LTDNPVYYIIILC